MDIMNKNGISEEFYDIILVPPESVERISNVQNNSFTHLTPQELEVYNALGEGRTARAISEKTGISQYDVTGALWQLEQKGLAERGYIETKKTEIDPGSAKRITETKRQEYFIPTAESSKIPELSGKIDFSKLTTEQLKAFVTIPEFSLFAKQMLVNRGYSVSVKEGKVKLRKKY
jgi:DNA-binding MarR family transcriptional regulator